MIYKRGKVCWYRFKWTIKHSDGRRENFLIQKSARTGNSRRATEVEEEHRRALRLGQVHPRDAWPKPKAPEAPTFRVFAQQFLDFASVHTKPSTKTFYEVCINRILRFSFLADAIISDINGDTIAKYANWRKSQQKPDSIVSINGELRTIRRMLRLAHDWGLIAKAPSVHELPGQQGRERVLSFAEERMYLAAASETLKRITILAADTGLRPNSELFPLRWSNVQIEGSKGFPNGVIHVPNGKTSSAIRNIPLTPRAREMMLELHRINGGKSAFVLPGPGKTGHIITIQHAHERAIRLSGLNSFEFYCWRHTFGTRCAESGMDKFSLARLMGHSSPRVAERYYVHVSESHVAAGFERFVDYQVAGTMNSMLPSAKTLQ